MKFTDTASGIYIKFTVLFTAIFTSVVLVFGPLMPTVMGLLGFKSFLGINFTGKTEKSYLNVLLMGLDKEETRSDVMMVAQLNLVTNSVNIIQIPRDTYISNKRNDKKINSAYGAGGPEKSISEVKTVVDVDIDKYVIITTSGFRDVVDAVGGIDYDVPMDMDYEDPVQDLYIHLKAGYQHLDGDKAEQFVRFRHGYATGDIGRVDAQSGFIKEAIRQIIDRNINKKEGDTEKLVTSVSKMVTTNFTLSEMLKYSPYLLSVDMDNVNIMMLQGVPEYRNQISYYIANDRKNAQLVREYFTPDISEADLSEVSARDTAVGKKSQECDTLSAPLINTPPKDISVYILDYSDTDGEKLKEYTELLKNSEYNVVGGVSSKTIFTDKTYCVSSDQTQLSAVVSQTLGFEKYYLNPSHSNDADVVIVIGKEE